MNPPWAWRPLLVQEIFRVIQRINQQGAAILLVEQNAHLALEVAHRAYILETGEIALERPGLGTAAPPPGPGGLPGRGVRARKLRFIKWPGRLISVRRGDPVGRPARG